MEGTPRPSLASRPRPQGQVQGFGLTASPVAQGPPGTGGLPTGPRRRARRRPGVRRALHPGRRLRSRLGSRLLCRTPLGRGRRLWGWSGARPTPLLSVVALQVILQRAGLGARVVAVRTFVGALAWRKGCDRVTEAPSPPAPPAFRSLYRPFWTRKTYPHRLSFNRAAFPQPPQLAILQAAFQAALSVPAPQFPPDHRGCPLTCVHSKVHFKVMR